VRERGGESPGTHGRRRQRERLAPRRTRCLLRFGVRGEFLAISPFARPVTRQDWSGPPAAQLQCKRRTVPCHQARLGGGSDGEDARLFLGESRERPRALARSSCAAHHPPCLRALLHPLTTTTLLFFPAETGGPRAAVLTLYQRDTQ
jgi:hypothetical protein